MYRRRKTRNNEGTAKHSMKNYWQSTFTFDVKHDGSYVASTAGTASPLGVYGSARPLSAQPAHTAHGQRAAINLRVRNCAAYFRAAAAVAAWPTAPPALHANVDTHSSCRAATGAARPFCQNRAQRTSHPQHRKGLFLELVCGCYLQQQQVCSRTYSRSNMRAGAVPRVSNALQGKQGNTKAKATAQVFHLTGP